MEGKANFIPTEAQYIIMCFTNHIYHTNSFTYFYHAGLLYKAVRSVIEEPAFSIPASSSRKLAEHLLSWMPEHSDAAFMFETEIVSLLSPCLKEQHSNPRERRCGRLTMLYVYLRINSQKPASKK